MPQLAVKLQVLKLQVVDAYAICVTVLHHVCVLFGREEREERDDRELGEREC